jgi:hypothetical protein
MHQRTCEIVEKTLFRMLFRRYAYIKSNVVIIIKLRLRINFHAKIIEKINSNEIAHFKMFNCKTFSLLKKVNALKKMKR